MTKEIVVELKLSAPKKHSKLFKPDGALENPPITGLYLMKSACEKLGDPERIEIAIRRTND